MSIKERPILYSQAMALATLRAENPKTQTRRIVKGQPSPSATLITGENRWRWSDTMLGPWFGCPYGKAGDRLWGREAFRVAHGYKGTPAEILSKDEIRHEAQNEEADRSLWSKLRPAIHLPRHHSRILQDVVSVRTERLHDISEADVIAEGIEFDGKYWRGGVHPVKGTLQCWPDPRRAYQALWETINGEGSWALNPLVYVITTALVKP